MARPRVFISSTFYDLKQVRAELERFVREMGYEPVLNERGHIAYGTDKALEEYCYREISNVDMLVSIVGGRFGSESNRGDYSISQIELKTAHKQGKHIYIFVERAVLAEHGTYKMNKENKDTKYTHVTDARVYKFLDEVFALQANNQVAGFEFAREITEYLREQWAGLFQTLLNDRSRATEMNVVAQLQASVQTLKELVEYLSKEGKNKDEKINAILLYNHPLFDQLREALKVEYRVFFINLAECQAWLKARSFKPVPKADWDAPEFMEWVRDFRSGNDTVQTLLKISAQVFDKNGGIRNVDRAQWKIEWVSAIESTLSPTEDDEIPF